VVLLSVPGGSAPVGAQQEGGLHNLVILHTNDTGGKLFSLRTADGRVLGGAYARARLIAERRRHKDLDWLLVDAGGFFGPTASSTLGQGYYEVELMNLMGYEAVGLGPEEFRYGVKVLKERIARAKFAVVAANVIDTTTNQPIGRPYVVLKKAGLRVGIFGLSNPMTPEILNPALTSGVTFENPEETLGRVLGELKEKTDIIVLLSQLGVTENLKLASRYPEINVIVGGGSGALLSQPYQVGDTLIVEAYKDGMAVGQLKLTYQNKDEGGVGLRYFDFRLITLDGKHPQQETPQVRERVTQIKRSVELKLSQVIAEAPRAVPATNLMNAENPLGVMAARAARDYVDAQAGMIPAGLIRGQIEAGPVTLGTLYRLIPGGDRVVKLTLRGDVLSRVIARSVRNIGGPGFLQVSGMSYEVFGDEVYNLKVAGEPVRADELYAVATVDSLVGGAYGYVELAELVRTDPATKRPLSDGEVLKNSGKTLRDVVIAWVRRNSPLTPPVEGTVRFVSAPPQAPKAEEQVAEVEEVELRPYEGLETPAPEGEEKPAAGEEEVEVEVQREGEGQMPSPGEVTVPVVGAGGSPGGGKPAKPTGTETETATGQVGQAPATVPLGAEVYPLGETEQEGKGGLTLRLKVDYVKPDKGRPWVRFIFQVINQTDELKILRFPTLQETDFAVRDPRSGKLIWNYAFHTVYVEREREVQLPAGTGVEYRAQWWGLANDAKPVAGGKLYRFEASLTTVDGPITVGFDALLREEMFAYWRS